MGARVKVFECFTGLLKLKHLVNDGVELDLLVTQQLAKISMILFCSYCNTPIQSFYVSQ